MMTVTCSRLLLVALTLLAVFHAAASFMCYEKELGDESSSVTACTGGSCYSVGGSVMNSKDSKKGCSEEKHEDGCVSAGIPGLVSGHTCYCNFPLCNSAFSPSIALPMLVLPVLLQRLLS